MKSTIPWTSACARRSPTGASRHVRSTSRWVAPPVTVRRTIDEPLGCIRPAVEEHALDPLEQVGLDVLVDGELAGVDDPHVEPCADRVVEERRVHRLAHGVVPAKGEGEVRDAARDEGARTPLLEQWDRLDVPLRKLRVLLDPGGHREHVRVENDVLGTESGLADQEVVGAPEDLDLPLDRLGLALARRRP